MLVQDRTRDTVISYAAPEDRLSKQVMIRLVERISGRQRIVRAYEQARQSLRPGDDVWAVALQALDITAGYSREKLAAVPRKGPLVVDASLTIHSAW